MKNQNNSSMYHPLADETLEQVSGGKYTGAVFAYTIQQGDNLSVLAHRYGTTVRVLQELNSITGPERVSAGNTIMIPQR